MNSTLPLWLRRLAWFGVAAWAVAIFIASSLTGPQIEEIGPPISDKIEHLIAFASGGVALTIALRWNLSWDWKKIVRVAVIALAIFGALDEFHQLFTPGRSGADPFDWMADCFGALLGVVVSTVIYARFFPPHRPASPGA